MECWTPVPTSPFSAAYSSIERTTMVYTITREHHIFIFNNQLRFHFITAPTICNTATTEKKIHNTTAVSRKVSFTDHLGRQQ
jgi:hypothetical protein